MNTSPNDNLRLRRPLPEQGIGSATTSEMAPPRHRPRVEGRTEFKNFDYGDPIDLTQFEAEVHAHHPSFVLLGW